MSQFTNRHGKKVSVSDDEIIINPSTQLPIANQSAKTPQPSRVRATRSLPRMRVSKRVGVTMTVLAVVIAVSMLVTADSVKRDYENQTAAMKRTIVDRGKQASSNETSPEKTIKSLRESLSAASDCKVQGIDVVSWYGPAKFAREECVVTADRYKKLQFALDDMTDMANYAVAMSSSLKSALAGPSSGEYAIISDYNDEWQQAQTSLERIKAPEILLSQHQTLIGKVKAVASAWGTLNAANNAKNTNDFRTAEATLNDRYSELRTVSDSIQTIILSTQTSINRYISELTAS